MSYIGDFRLGDTFDTKFTTVSTAGAPTTLAGTPVISAYVGNNTTQLTAGITLTVDFDAVTGMHNVRVVATSGNGYATASNYQLVITTGTVGGTSVVGYVVAEFSIEARSAVIPTVSGRTLDVTATGAAGIDWANVENPTTALNLSATNIDVDQVVASVSGAVGSVTGLTAATVHSDLDDIQARLPAALTVGGNIKADALAWNGLATVALPATPTNITAATGITLTATTGLGNQTANITGNLSGSVGSVTGAVGSVTGAVGSVTAGVTLAANAITAAAIATDAGEEIADAILLRKLDRTGTGTDAAQERTVVNALRAVRNKASIAAGTLTVTKEDDVTTAWTAAVTTAAGNPLSGIDPT